MPKLHKQSFQLVAVNDRKDILLFTCPSEDERNKWTQTLEFAFKKLSEERNIPKKLSGDRSVTLPRPNSSNNSVPSSTKDSRVNPISTTKTGRPISQSFPNGSLPRRDVVSSPTSGKVLAKATSFKVADSLDSSATGSNLDDNWRDVRIPF